MNTILMQIQNIQDTYYLLTAISAVVILTLSFLLTCIRLPQQIECTKFNKTRRYLALSYFILGFSGLVTSFIPNQGARPVELLLITASIASFQSLLFTSTHIIFVQPDVVRKPIILKHFFAILGCTFLLAFSYYGQWLNNDLLVSAILIPYMAQQVFYVHKFHKLHYECVRQMEHYYDEEQEARLRWVNYSFYSALSIGLFSLVASVSGLFLYSLFIVVYTIFYTYMVVLVYNNKLITQVIFPAVVHAQMVEKVEQIENRETASCHDTEEIRFSPNEENRDQKAEFEVFKSRLEEWISLKGYLQKDLSVDDIATTMNIDRDFLRYYFRTYIHTDFRTWRSELRIEEAKRLMIEYPDYTFTKIAEIVGFNHRANFFNQFVKIEGMTPTEWKDIQNKG